MDVQTRPSSYEELLRSVRDKAAEFDAALSKVKKTNEELRNRAEKTLQSLAELMGTVAPRMSQKCTVCYTRDVVAALTPCGHVFCASCAARAERTRCHQCRSRVDTTMRIYIA